MGRALEAQVLVVEVLEQEETSTFLVVRSMPWAKTGQASVGEGRRAVDPSRLMGAMWLP